VSLTTNLPDLRSRTGADDRFYEVSKRVIDVTVSVVLLLVALPILVVAAIAILIEDGGPVLFAQERVGRDGDIFRIWKLRSMVTDAEARRKELEHLNHREGPLFKIVGDPRVTKVGRLLRASSVDELPQLLNVIVGEMSLIGPRPAMPSEVARFSPQLHRRHEVTPGISGMWQIYGRDHYDECTLEQHDLDYVDRRSLGLDLQLMALTVTTVARRAVRHAGAAAR
jgi:lipopolysaccharide/colanic/teichoic acid biosynthesis glycosyltransferase